MKIYLACVAAFSLFAAWNFFSSLPEKETEAIELLTFEGYSDIELTGYQFFACSEDDLYRIGFAATKNFRRIDGVVCSDPVKGTTIRVFN